MTDTATQDLVTKIDVIPDLTGLTSFDAALDRTIAKVKQLDAAIKHVNNLQPKSRYAPPAATGAPSVATTAAVAAIAGTGANIITRTPLAAEVQREVTRIAKRSGGGAASGFGGFGGFLPPPGGGAGGGGGGALMLPPPGTNWSAGRAGGLFDPSAGNPFAKYDTSARSFSGEPLNATKKPVADAVKKATGGRGSLFSANTMIGGAGIAAAGVSAFNAISASMDTIESQQNQLARLPQTIGSAEKAYEDLNNAASEVRTNGDAFINTYANIATATQKMGLSQERATKAAQGLTSALALGGGSQQAKDNALYQMGQAFSSNRFGGDEFKSFMEAIGTMAPTVAKAFDTDVAGLRQMSEQGKLTADVVVKAFEKIADSNIDLLKKQGWTWGQVTTVMKNDWNNFLAEATIDGDWTGFTDWAADTLIPWARDAEKAVADFWSTLSDDSKKAMLIGILAAVGSAFAALAIPVFAATWPFLAVGAAVFLVYEAFVEWKHWMDGNSGNIFASLFGSFDEFEKRYPHIIGLLSKMATVIDKVDSFSEFLNGKLVDGLTSAQKNASDDVRNKILEFNKNGSPGFLDFLDGILGAGSNLMKNSNNNPLLNNKNAFGSANINSGNTTSVNATVNVNRPEDAGTALDSIASSANTGAGLGNNIAEGSGII
ncbi:tape measure protein [Kosakonia sacchari]|uniref:tape measure protein n=1 Tax=Kosakonia sacchari TaxID=1158459 RepID=UPI0015848611|nr:tape measure protein [Kosakonia sacchari]NUL35040.1 tape measure protein [Kosakonia sacchari]